jgi:energy-coupling factor transport system substrate-specific component
MTLTELKQTIYRQSPLNVIRPFWGQILSTLILLLASGLGLWAFLFPFFLPPSVRDTSITATRNQAHTEDAPLIFILLLGLCLVVIVANLETNRLDARAIAVLGVLAGINATLRLIPGPGGFSPMFVLPILCGYVFGPTFGFLLGALSMLVSGIITSGVGPWLPFQMFGLGWVGLLAGWLSPLVSRPRWAVLMLAGWGLLAGFLYGLVTNLWFWPYLAAPAGAELVTWEPGLGIMVTLTRYGIFYLTTSLWWDAGRAFGNLVLILLVGPPVLRLLKRFKSKFQFSA